MYTVLVYLVMFLNVIGNSVKLISHLSILVILIFLYSWHVTLDNFKVRTNVIIKIQTGVQIKSHVQGETITICYITPLWKNQYKSINTVCNVNIRDAFIVFSRSNPSNGVLQDGSKLLLPEICNVFGLDDKHDFIVYL